MCISPLTLRNPKFATHACQKQFNTVPCGKCPECVKSRVNSWVFRLNKELERSSSPLFLTLTYDDDHIKTDKYGNNTLIKSDVQDFIKRLRFHYAKTSTDSIKYYAVGEYGSNTKRPHYHIIMFNCDNLKLIESTWQNGFISASKLTQKRIYYTLKYITKSKMVLIGNQLKEFSLMSKRLGSNYLTPSVKEYHRSYVNERSFVTTLEGFKMPIPKYYKTHLYDDEQKENLTNYLQSRAEYYMEEKAEKISRQTGKPFNIVLKNLEISKLNSKLCKSSDGVL